MIALVLAQNSDIHLEDVSLPLALAAAAATGLWLLLLLLFALVTRPREVEADPPTMDLGQEPPAIVDFLVNHCRSTANAVAGTLLDLAARHYLAIEDREPETVCRVGHEPPTDLLPYERLLYDHVASVAGTGFVPTQALTTGTKAQSENWSKRFAGLVVKDAKSRGLAEDRWSIKEWAAQRFVGLAAALLVIAVAAQANATEAGIFACGAVAAGAHGALAKLFGTQRLTPQGVKVTAHWLGVRAFLTQGEGFHDLPAGAVVLWDRYMAYSGAMGLARTALKSLPMGAEDDHKAWSDYGSEWHQVHVRYPRTRLIWGRTAAGVMLVGLIMLVLGAGGIYAAIKVYDFADGSTSTDRIAYWIQMFSLGLGAAAILVAFWGLSTVNLAVIDLGQKREVQGRVVRCRSYPRGNNGTDYFVAVDDGSNARIKAWLVSYQIYGQAHEGAVVSALTTRRQAHVYKMETLKPAPESLPAATAPAAEAPVQAGAAVASALLGLSAPSVDPAALVTAEDVARVLGEPVGPATAVVNKGAAAPMRASRYVTASGRASVSLMVGRGALVQMMSRVASRGNKGFDLNGMQAVIRGDAIMLTGADVMLAIHLEGHAPADKEAALRELASAAAERLRTLSPVPTP